MFLSRIIIRSFYKKATLLLSKKVASFSNYLCKQASKPLIVLAKRWYIREIRFVPLPKFCPNIIPYKQKFCSKFMVYNLFTSDILFFNLKVNYMQH